MYGTAWKSVRERAADAWERAHGTAALEGFRRVNHGSVSENKWLYGSAHRGSRLDGVIHQLKILARHTVGWQDVDGVAEWPEQKRAFLKHAWSLGPIWAR
jgi:hypothetical protein